MSDTQRHDPLLPVNSSSFEHSLSAAGARVENVPVPLQHLWNPWQCPAHFLPWLADGLSVDAWDSAWPEHIQRQVIAQSVPNHRVKGTVGSLKHALLSLDADIELQEWWQTGGVPHTATILALAKNNLNVQGGSFITPKLQAQLWQAVSANKPARTQIDFQIGNIQQNQLYISCVGQTSQIHKSALQQCADGQFESCKISASTTTNHIQLSSQSLRQHVDDVFEPVSVSAQCVTNHLHIEHHTLRALCDTQLNAPDMRIASTSGCTTFQTLTMELT
ncbi:MULTISPECIES: phage tail protein I [Pseudoalteromonas]|uniref:Phage tail protein I n=1 Tax=Pseudoalteromonas amylolytica TaxID=1859457 RepID=A0A1S1MYK9_9GAMM|nr:MULTISPECIES: phage tail protein I [Pseudoalteromonas]OHU87814.1 phage tail protein I [Pseudoalteromonas sp. JW3]OHU91254.1 phage tail protein I [Pseudoalteromonas amylolytica]